MATITRFQALIPVITTTSWLSSGPAKCRAASAETSSGPGPWDIDVSARAGWLASQLLYYLVVKIDLSTRREGKAPVRMPHPPPDSLVEVIAERFRVHGEPMRIRIIDRRRDGEARIGELAEALHTSWQNVSKHVGILAGAGLVAREKQADSVRCRIADETVLELCEQVCGGLQRQIAALQTLLGSGAGI